MAVAFMMSIKELRRNGGETAATAENRQQQPLNYTFLKYLSQTYFFSQKIALTFALKKKFGGRWRFSAVATVSPPFLRSSLIDIIKATVIPKLTAVTHFLAEFPR